MLSFELKQSRLSGTDAPQKTMESCYRNSLLQELIVALVRSQGAMYLLGSKTEKIIQTAENKNMQKHLGH